MFQNHKLTNQFSEGVYIFRATVGEGTEQNFEKTMKKYGENLIKNEK
jgi:hypothetical protein